MSPGKAMLHKILSECSGPTTSSLVTTPKLEKSGFSSDAAGNLNGFDDFTHEQVPLIGFCFIVVSLVLWI